MEGKAVHSLGGNQECPITFGRRERGGVWFLILSRGILVTLAVENEAEVKTHPFQLIHSMADLNPGLPISQGQWIGSFQRHEIITIRSTSHALSASTGLISPSDGLLLQLEY